MPREKVFDMPCRGVNLMPLKSQHATTGAITLLGSPLLKILGVPLANVLGEWYAGASDNNYFRDISGNSRHLTGTNGPTFADSTLVGWDGNPLKAYSFTAASSQLFSLAHSSWMNVFDGDFSISALIKVPSSAPGSNQYFFSHGALNADGAIVSLDSTGYLIARLNKASTAAYSNSPSTLVDGNCHVIHVVRNSSMLTVYADGVPGPCVSVTDYGIDGSRTLYIGCVDGPGSYWNNHVSYVRLQNTALEYYQIQREVAAFQGILASRGSGRYVVPYFTRASTTTVSRRAGTVSQVKMPSNWPARSYDQGLRIEQSRSSTSSGNLFTYTSTFGTNWTKAQSSVAGTTVTLPDGSTSTTATLHEDGTAASIHGFRYNVSVTSGTPYCLQVKARYNGSAGTPREWIALQVGDGTNAKTQYFNIRYGSTGTVSGALTGGYGVEPQVDGYMLCWVWATAGATATGTMDILVAESNGDYTFDGADQDSVFICEPQLESGAHPTSYMARATDAAVARVEDFCIVQPFNLNKELAGLVAATPRLLFNGTESLNAATVTPTVGSYSFTKNGRPQQGWSEAEGYHHLYNGSSDYLSLSSASDFNPAGDFSVTFVYTPLSVSGTQIIILKSGASGNQGWYISQSTTGIYFFRSTSGSNSFAATVNSCFEVGKPALVTCSFSTTSGMTARVDAITAGTEGTTGATYASSQNLHIGASSTPASYFNGRLHYLAYYDGYVVTAGEHANMYSRLKQDGILPVSMSASTVKTKLIVEYEIRAEFDSKSDMPTYPVHLGLSGNIGISGSGRNRFDVVGNYSTGKYTAALQNNDSSGGGLMSSELSNCRQWKKYKVKFDLSDLAQSSFRIDDVAQTTTSGTMTGSATFNLHDTLFRICQSYNASVANSNSYIRNIKLYLE